ncbi:TPA: efflux RND transporter periplasmic adaptor subunit [Serratia marcescens]|uniref:efflux RND transporter periplasmic adaptor subunit n=1 Tax=Serratia marcescens TaxID=615 RepID=UPI0018D3994D|nr:efflux RND transporter periplasmic adaptor subunit [Serratia marcescens]MBH1896779.1 efflux RND transporter periplasmic adaptor subunit [Serratia marcescens]MBH2692040.1 efflux RND transporter periplasmic adaptor subunit [Serratia marcescens]MBH2738596.1 efflux RND transporter periplasmic adaptor subunit [Serratia marcescens]MBH2828698.1 efflux RND transporter periplasmic adaptor subunit [Serratia marcescens]MBH3221231.1 efflux RND transporter periplasmic adaptor subunit [Serratia marcescen
MQRKTLLVLGLSLLLAACDGQNAGAPAGAGAEQEVGVVTLRGQSVTLSSELTGRVNATMTSDVRPQVDGIIKQRLFTEGAEVKAGQVLYQIDPASYQASYDQAAAQLKNAQATVQSTRLKSQRYAALVKENGVSQQDADDAKAAYLAAVASVAQYQAALETARINLAYTQVRAPIAGRIGISSVTPGALVTASQSDALATIRALDPIYVDLTQSSAQLLKLRRQQAALQRGAVTPVAIKLEDGTPYAHAGKLELTEVAVDEATGSVTLRAVFPNPEHELLPGMYVHATVANGVVPKAILAPQQGITRNAKGEATALVVDEQNKVAQRTVSAERVVGSNWLIGSGLNEGDRLIVEGTSKVTIGAAVKPVEVSVDKTQRGEQ